MRRFHAKLLMIAGLVVLAVSGPLASSASAQAANRLQEALDSLKAGGRTLAGPGIYTRQPSIADFVIQLTDNTNVCGTVTLVAGDSVQLNLRDAANANVQGVIANATQRTAAGCGSLIQNVELMCTGAQACLAVWRVDSR